MSSGRMECDQCEAPIQGQSYTICPLCREMTCRVCTCSCSDDLVDSPADDGGTDITMEDQLRREEEAACDE